MILLVDFAIEQDLRLRLRFEGIVRQMAVALRIKIRGTDWLVASLLRRTVVPSGPQWEKGTRR